MFAKDQWHEIDTGKLKGELAKAFAAYEESNDEMKLQREVLEGVLTISVSEHIPEGLEARFAYRWGKVSVDVWTHKIKGLTESDFILAAKIDAVS